MEPRNLKAVFNEALDRPAGPERSAFLDEACREDAALRAQVEQLLGDADRVGRFLEAPPGCPDPGKSALNPSQRAEEGPFDQRLAETLAVGPGSRIGPYELIEKIGEGGMGVVYMAVQEKPVRRSVALKIIKLGMDTDQVIARFEAERQALALMDHQNIARVLDVGTTATGRPFFVMDLVKGDPITEYCDRNRLSPKERLELFAPVCQAIQHAHQKGIIHRDVKPSNVLVTHYDPGAPGVPKVIDFGVAKAIDQRQSERTMFTQFGQVVGTLEYMSPEQAGIGAIDVDTRSDIYSLGVLLYELLTGSTPLERANLREAAYMEILRRIREDDPPRPSMRLSNSRDTLPSISAQRQTEPVRLTRLVRGELDWIVMKALDKDRTRRYETASGFARDIERYLAGDAVEAGPPGATYRLRKLARKHRIALATAGAFAVLLLLAVAISTYLAIRITRSERLVRRERDRAVDAEGKAQASLVKLREEQKKTKQSESEALAVLEFFKTKVLAAARPKGEEGGLGIDATIRAAVDSSALGIEKSFAGQPALEASIRDTLGQSYIVLGDPALAIHHHSRALGLRRQVLGADDPDTLTSISSLATAYWSAGRLADALALHEEALKGRQATLGPDHADTLESMGSLAVAYHDAGQLAAALPLYEETIKRLKPELGPDHPNRLTYLNNLASGYQDAGRLAEALPLFEEILKRRRATLSADHRHTLISMSNLARAYKDAGRLAEAIPLHEETLKRQKATLGLDHANTLTSMSDLALAYRDAGRPGEAVPLLDDALKRRRGTLDPDHPDTLLTMNNLALAYKDTGRLNEALTLYEDTLKRTKAKLGPEHNLTLQVMKNLGAAYEAAGRQKEALPLFEAALKVREATLGPDHPNTLNSMTQLARAYLGDKPEQAEPLLRQTVAILSKKDPDNWQSFDVQSMLGASLLGQKKYAEAEPFLLAGYDGMKARQAKIPGPSQKRLAAAGARIVALYGAWGKPDKALEWRKKLEIPMK
jgi:serine/threonine protein kinase/tetratricopeptide (TPR) repeat protein